jgi:heptaprenyl diphosphate synthase
MKRLKPVKLALYAMMICIAMILSYVETLIPVPFFAPGMKLGLANIVTMVAVYRMGIFDAAAISLSRVCLSAMTFGNIFSLAYSLAGSVCSLAVMAALKRTGKFGIAGVSAAGGVCHNIAQIGVAAFLLETGELVYYLPVLFITGTITGFVIGILCKIVLKSLGRVRW